MHVARLKGIREERREKEGDERREREGGKKKK
jgi:hypothetical protein